MTRYVSDSTPWLGILLATFNPTERAIFDDYRMPRWGRELALGIYHAIGDGVTHDELLEHFKNLVASMEQDR